jgi:hypothetical protein
MCWQAQISIPIGFSLNPLQVTRTTLWCRSSLFWDIMHCSLLKASQCCARTCHSHLQCQRRASSPYYMVHACFVHGLFYNPEISLKLWLTFSTIHSIIFQRIFSPLLWEPKILHIVISLLSNDHYIYAWIIVVVDVLCSSVFSEYWMMDKVQKPNNSEWVTWFKLRLS